METSLNTDEGCINITFKNTDFQSFVKEYYEKICDRTNQYPNLEIIGGTDTGDGEGKSVLFN